MRRDENTEGTETKQTKSCECPLCDEEKRALVDAFVGALTEVARKQESA